MHVNDSSGHFLFFEVKRHISKMICFNMLFKCSEVLKPIFSSNWDTLYFEGSTEWLS